MPDRPRARFPRILEMPSQRVAVVRTRGEPQAAASEALPALYGAVYTLKFALKKRGIAFTVESLRARWFNIPPVRAGELRGEWALPVPHDTADVPQKVPGIEVAVEDWDYGIVAEILHTGSYSDEGPTIERLRSFIADQGYEVVGSHEEVYLTRPTAKVPKTIIRYPVRRRGG